MTTRRIIKLANAFINKYSSTLTEEETLYSFDEKDRQIIHDNFKDFIEEFHYLDGRGELDFLKEIPADYQLAKTYFDVLTRFTDFNNVIRKQPGGMGSNHAMVTAMQRLSKDHPKLNRMFTHLRTISDIVEARWREWKRKRNALERKLERGRVGEFLEKHRQIDEQRQHGAASALEVAKARRERERQRLLTELGDEMGEDPEAE